MYCLNRRSFLWVHHKKSYLNWSVFKVSQPALSPTPPAQPSYTHLQSPSPRHRMLCRSLPRCAAGSAAVIAKTFSPARRPVLAALWTAVLFLCNSAPSTWQTGIYVSICVCSNPTALRLCTGLRIKEKNVALPNIIVGVHVLIRTHSGSCVHTQSTHAVCTASGGVFLNRISEHCILG